ncbi:MAG: type VI secretion system baseplate subunit TssK, partial [Pirellulaceae bacterium]|nr:type VI secretion system baseplate subunit TssK [Pirellulaceae bacterium]
MQNYPPNWSEGLFLRPQHFQSADRYWHELISLSSHMDGGFNYGLFALEINHEALKNQVLEVVRCQARTKDGTLVSFESGSIDRVDLAEKLESDPSFTEMLRENNGLLVYLAIPQLKLTRPNIAEQRSPNGRTSRYVGLNKQFEDESTGDNPQEVSVRELNATIQFESDDLSGFERVPLFRMRRSQGAQLVLERDPEYVAPCLNTQAVDLLQRNFMEAAYDTLKSRSDLLSRQVNDAGITFSTQTAGAVDRLMKLQSINQGLAALHCHSFAAGVHPYVAYATLCQIVGHLSVFGDEKRIGDMPHYDHENLHFIFQWVLHRIQQLVEIDDSGMHQIYFKGSGGNRLQVRLQPQWFSRDWKIIL